MDEEIRKGSSISMVLCIAWTIVPCVLSDAGVHYDPKKPLCSVRKTLIVYTYGEKWFSIAVMVLSYAILEDHTGIK